MSYANQKIITINRELPKQGTKEPYLCIYADRLSMAAENLNNTAFKLYIYLITNANNFKLEFSPQHISNNYGISLSSARRAITELIEKGYVVETSSGRFEFYEMPHAKPLSIEIKVVKRGFATTDGGIEWATLKELKDLYLSAGRTEEEALEHWETGIKEGAVL